MPATLPSPFPGAVTAPTIRSGAQIAQGVIGGPGVTDAQLNEIAQVQKGLVWYNPSIAGLTRLTSKLKNARIVENSRFFHLEKQRLPRSSAVVSTTGGATTPSALTLTASTGARFRVGDLLYNSESGDIALITSFASADVVNVTPNIGDDSPSGTLWAATHNVVNIGNAYEDGAGGAVSFHVIEDERSFFCQIFKDAIEQSRRYQNTALYEGEPWANARKQLEQEHLLSCEYAYFFGKPSLTQSGSNDKFTTTMGGLDFYLDTNRVDFDGDSTISKAFFDSVMVGAMQEGHSGYENKELANKTLFGSQRWLAKLNALGDDKIRIIEPSEKTYGLRIMQYQGTWGVLNVINAPVLNKTGLQDRAFIVDLEHLRPAYFKGGETKYEDNIQVPGTDGKKAQYISDKSLIVELKVAHTALFGLAE